MELHQAEYYKIFKCLTYSGEEFSLQKSLNRGENSLELTDKGKQKCFVCVFITSQSFIRLLR